MKIRIAAVIAAGLLGTLGTCSVASADESPFAPAPARTQSNDNGNSNPIGTSKTFGLGVGGGSLSYGISPKLFLSESRAVQGAIGWTFYGLNFGVDYLQVLGTALNHSAGRLWYGAGVGAEVLMYNYLNQRDVEIGVAAVAEVGWHFREFPIEVTGSVRPTFYIGDYFGGFYVAGGGAVRWYF